MKRVIYTLLAALLVLAGLTGAASCGGQTATTTPAGGDTVSIKDFAFNPATITVSVGTTVTWTNEDSATHTVTSRTGAFDSGNMSKGSHFSHTFDAAGDYEYYCAIHPSMVGHVIVK